MDDNHSLPNQFKDLTPFVSSWALATESERNKKRLSSTMEEIQAYYNTLLPRIDGIIAYLNQFSLGKMPGEAIRLLYLALSFMEISPAVELFGQPDEANVFEAARFRIIER